MKAICEIKTDLGNNESRITKGIYEEADGTFLAMTATRSKTFKTLRGAKKFLGLV